MKKLLLLGFLILSLIFASCEDGLFNIKYVRTVDTIYVFDTIKNPPIKQKIRKIYPSMCKYWISGISSWDTISSDQILVSGLIGDTVIAKLYFPITNVLIGSGEAVFGNEDYRNTSEPYGDVYKIRTFVNYTKSLDMVNINTRVVDSRIESSFSTYFNFKLNCEIVIRNNGIKATYKGVYNQNYVDDISNVQIINGRLYDYYIYKDSIMAFCPSKKAFYNANNIKDCNGEMAFLYYKGKIYSTRNDSIKKMLSVFVTEINFAPEDMCIINDSFINNKDVFQYLNQNFPMLSSIGEAKYFNIPITKNIENKFISFTFLKDKKNLENPYTSGFLIKSVGNGYVDIIIKHPLKRI